VIRSCLHHVNTEEVLKIKLTEREEDCIAWHYEKSDILSVRSAYKLALEQDQAEMRQVGSSSDGSRNLYNKIWSVQVPPKVHIFVWKLPQDGLATQCNKKQHTLTEDATCHICGREEENGHHDVVRCTKASALHHELKRRLLLPDESQFIYTGPDWLLLLLNSVILEVKANILLLPCCAWNLRNDSTYDKGDASIKGEALFLVSYSESLNPTT
jgi:hypothetical protein